MDRKQRLYFYLLMMCGEEIQNEKMMKQYSKWFKAIRES